MDKVTHVSVKVSEGGHNLITVDDFIDMSFDQRMSLISSKSITFLNESGDKVSMIDGVKYTTELLRKRKYL